MLTSFALDFLLIWYNALKNPAARVCRAVRLKSASHFDSFDSMCVKARESMEMVLPEQERQAGIHNIKI